MSKVTSIMMVGVGGQGSILASKLMGAVLMKNGYDVKLSEVHGMSQRGGSVQTYVRYGKEVSAPVIDPGEADFLLCFEALEAARYLPYLKEGGTVITAQTRIDPMPVITGAMDYPADILQKLENSGVKVISADALAKAEAAGSAKAVNVVMLGLLAKQLDLPESDWLEAIDEIVPERFREMNKKAFLNS
ncbi:MAG: indolepyruvate oxidoreductase subunit beta [Oscillospiraceae bacterium]|nr:indolepyruvate oxidoreductase subunit beta [Oscillospiraceae bacterium]